MRRTTSTSIIALLATGSLVAAACGGGDSALDAGLDDEPTEETSAPATDPTEDEIVEDEEDAAVEEEAEDAVADDAEEEIVEDEEDAVAEEEAEEVAADPLAALPPCPVDALDSADGPVEITMWFGLTTALGDVLQQLTDEYNASQDRVVVTIENQTDYETTIDNYFNLGPADRPDLLLAPEYVLQAFAESESFVPADACIEASALDTSTFLERTMVAYSFDEVLWGVPFNVSSPVLFSVGPMLAAAGVTEPPITLDEVRTASQAIVDSGAATYGLVVDVNRGSGGAYLEQFFGRVAEPYVDNGNGRLGRATEVLFGTQTGVDLLTFLRDLHADGLSFNVGENAGGLDAFLKLVDPTEPGAMTVSTSAALVQVLDAIDAGLGGDLTRDDLIVSPLIGPTDEVSAQVSGASIWFPDGRGDVATAAAWDFARFLIDPQTQSTWAAGTGYVPMRSDALDLDPIATVFADDPRFRVSYDQVSTPLDSIEQSRAVLGPQREVRQLVADLLATLYADPSADVATLLADTVVESNDLIGTYNRLN